MNAGGLSGSQLVTSATSVIVPSSLSRKTPLNDDGDSQVGPAPLTST